MSIFGAIRDAIFGGSASASPVTPTASQPAAGKATPAPGAPAAAPGGKVDIAAMLDRLSDESDEDFDWRRSIVDLMKLLKLDSSLKARKQLANELGFTGDTNDSASMNIWLHKQVMTKLEASGGIVPAELKS